MVLPNSSRNFSTHILTRRMTIYLTIIHLTQKLFNSHPHKEDDDCVEDVIAVNAFFQLTSSQGG